MEHIIKNALPPARTKRRLPFVVGSGCEAGTAEHRMEHRMNEAGGKAPESAALLLLGKEKKGKCSCEVKLRQNRVGLVMPQGISGGGSIRSSNLRWLERIAQSSPGRMGRAGRSFNFFHAT